MPHNELVALWGVVMNVFAHRFTKKAEGKVHLADLGPKGAEAFPRSEGVELALKGERRPSEIKVIEISRPGHKPVLIEHKKPHHRPGHHPESPSSPRGGSESRLESRGSCGLDRYGRAASQARTFRGPCAKRQKGPWAELHVDLDGGLQQDEGSSSGRGEMG